MEADALTVLIGTERSNTQNNIFAIVMHITYPENVIGYHLKKKALYLSYLMFFYSAEDKVVRL